MAQPEHAAGATAARALGLTAGWADVRSALAALLAVAVLFAGPLVGMALDGDLLLVRSAREAAVELRRELLQAPSLRVVFLVRRCRVWRAAAASHSRPLDALAGAAL